MKYLKPILCCFLMVPAVAFAQKTGDVVKEISRDVSTRGGMHPRWPPQVTRRFRL